MLIKSCWLPQIQRTSPWAPGPSPDVLQVTLRRRHRSVKKIAERLIGICKENSPNLMVQNPWSTRYIFSLNPKDCEKSVNQVVADIEIAGLNTKNICATAKGWLFSNMAGCSSINRNLYRHCRDSQDGSNDHAPLNPTFSIVADVSFVRFTALLSYWLTSWDNTCLSGEDSPYWYLALNEASHGKFGEMWDFTRMFAGE